MAWRDQTITLEEAKAVVARDRYKEELPESRGCTFSKDKINEILNQQNCIGIRIYFGRDESFKYTLVVVGVQGDQANDPPGTCNDMHAGLIAEYGYSVHLDDVKDDSGSPLARD